MSINNILMISTVREIDSASKEFRKTLWAGLATILLVKSHKTKFLGMYVPKTVNIAQELDIVCDDIGVPRVAITYDIESGKDEFEHIYYVTFDVDVRVLAKRAAIIHMVSTQQEEEEEEKPKPPVNIGDTVYVKNTLSGKFEPYILTTNEESTEVSAINLKFGTPYSSPLKLDKIYVDLRPYLRDILGGTHAPFYVEGEEPEEGN